MCKKIKERNVENTRFQYRDLFQKGKKVKEKKSIGKLADN